MFIADFQTNDNEATSERAPPTRVPPSSYYNQPEVVDDRRRRPDLNQAVGSALRMFGRPDYEKVRFLRLPINMAGDGSKLVIGSETGDVRLVMEWVAGQWSSCTRSCGGDGTRVKQNIN